MNASTGTRVCRNTGAPLTISGSYSDRQLPKVGVIENESHGAMVRADGRKGKLPLRAYDTGHTLSLR